MDLSGYIGAIYYQKRILNRNSELGVGKGVSEPGLSIISEVIAELMHN